MPRCARPVLRLTLAVMLLPAARAEAAAEPADSAVDILPLNPSRGALLAIPLGVPANIRLSVVLLMGDVDGAAPRAAAYSRRLVANGVAVLAPDVSDTETDGHPDPPLPAADRLRQALGAILRHERLDPRRIVVLGLGEGARAAILGTTPEVPVAGLALLYPGCDAALEEAAAAATGTMPVLLLHGDIDSANRIPDCDRLACAFPAAMPVVHRVMRGATYGWDAYDGVRPGGATWLTHPASEGDRALARPDMTTTLIAVDRVLGFVLAALATMQGNRDVLGRRRVAALGVVP